MKMNENIILKIPIKETLTEVAYAQVMRNNFW